MSDDANTLVNGSNPCRTASFSAEIEGSGSADTVLTQETPKSEAESEKDVKFPKLLKHRNRVLAKIYRPSKSYPLYRLAWSVAGKRQMKGFARYGAAKNYGDELVKDLAKGSQVTALTPGQATDALAALERLQRHYEATGKRLSLLAAASMLCEASAKLGDKPVDEAVEGYLRSVATVKRIDLNEAVEQFIAERKTKTIAKDGRRPKLSPEHFYLTSIWLREFGATFPGSAVCDLTKQHMALYMGKHENVSPKTRNERRGVVKMLLRWCSERDYVPSNHRLFEPTEMKAEADDPENIDLYTPEELRALLTRASRTPATTIDREKPEQDFRDLLPVLALAGLAGMRFKEIIRMDWADVFHKSGHIEVKAHKAKTRSRRLIPICSSLAAWLEPYRQRTGLVWVKSYDMLHIDFAALREALTNEIKIPNRRNGLRHAFVSAHFAAYSDENLTAAQAGNSPDMIHGHYKGLMTKQEGETWFAVSPIQPENVILIPSASQPA